MDSSKQIGLFGDEPHDNDEKQANTLHNSIHHSSSQTIVSDTKSELSNSSEPNTLSVLIEWQKQGVLRAIDRQWVEQLVLHAEAQAQARNTLKQQSNAIALIAGALCSAYLGAGHICLDLAALWDNPPEGMEQNEFRAILRSHNITSVSQWCEQLLDHALIAAPISQNPVANNTPMVLAGTRLYLHRYYEYEKQVLTYLHTQCDKPPFEIDTALLEQLFPKKPNIEPQQEESKNITEKEPQTSTTLDWQKIAVANAASLSFAVISGGPGTGKTTTVTKLLALLVAQSAAQSTSGKKAPLRIELAAPTGKAAARLTESIAKAKKSLPLDDDIKQAIPEQASTLHRLLGSDFGRSRFKHNKLNPLHLDVLLVDEVSMVDLPMMAKLLDAMPAHGRLILLGDKDQLASVEAGSVLGDLSHGIEHTYFQPAWATHLSRITGDDLTQYGNASAPPISRALTLLRTSYRFNEHSGIGQLAKAMNAGDEQTVLQCLQGHLGDVHWCTFDEKTGKADIETLAKGYDDYWEAVRNKVDIAHLYETFSRYQILTAVRQGEVGVDKINAQLEHHFYQRGRIKDPRTWYAGKAVMLTRNDASLGLFNGDIGLCLPDDTQRLRVWFLQADGRFTGLLPSRLSEFEVVFAMTVHKSQGSEFDRVALLMPLTPSPVLTKELIYTGITRARQDFTLWGSAHLIRMAVTSSIERHSGLTDRLWRQENTKQNRKK